MAQVQKGRLWQRNRTWTVAVEESDDRTTASPDQCILAVLQDIRDELRELNGVMQCHNVADGFRALQRIDRRLERNGMLLTKPKKPKRRAK